MHPPSFTAHHRLSDWPECRIEARCPKCRHVAYIPVTMIRASCGDQSFDKVVALLRCSACGARPAPVYLLAGQHRQRCWGSAPDWAIELVAAEGY